MFPFVAASIDRNTKCKKTKAKKRNDTKYSEIVAGVTKDTGQQAWGDIDLSSLHSMVKKFRKMSVETLDEHCDSGLYTLSYLLPDG